MNALCDLFMNCYLSSCSWYSWSIHSLVNGVYAFGFLFMLPQLFVNYKLKSVAHLPFKAFMYKVILSMKKSTLVPIYNYWNCLWCWILCFLWLYNLRTVVNVTRCYEITLVPKHLNMKFSSRCVDKASCINSGARWQ